MGGVNPRCFRKVRWLLASVYAMRCCMSRIFAYKGRLVCSILLLKLSKKVSMVGRFFSAARAWRRVRMVAKRLCLLRLGLMCELVCSLLAGG